ncbi:methyltransferase family protein [Maribacter spongiicola]|uniref:Methyltransferase family protein n=1 Tax=Maribacter spongiicola TaxID=1206753 RepID=A0A4R7K7V5_9FLAO|nr:class I SAM-dependent methyltransferase [Maribacter spongiicola]TDT46712.1 methyltransferase family protein [Maribacter spongiicola]
MKSKIVLLIGDLLVFLMPKKAKELAETGMTITDGNKVTLTERFIRKSLLRKVEINSDHETLSRFHKAYWENQGNHFFAATSDSFEKNFLPECSFIFELLKEKLSTKNERFNTIVEIGTGNGKVLNYLSEQLPQIERFIGIDLNQNQISQNRITYKKNTQLEFVASDAFDWVNTYANKNMIFVTSRGVLEYFTESRLQDFLQQVNRLGNTVFIAIEPNGVDHNLKLNKHSEPYGYERSFSHNYELLFKNAGFNLWHHSKKESSTEHYLTYMGADNYSEKEILAATTV